MLADFFFSLTSFLPFSGILVVVFSWMVDRSGMEVVSALVNRGSSVVDLGIRGFLNYTKTH